VATTADPGKPPVVQRAQRPPDIKAVPVRHYGTWVFAAVVIYVAAAVVVSLAKNPNMEWNVVGEYLFKPLTLRGVLVTIELTIIAMIIGGIGGVVLAVMRLSKNPVLGAIATFYIWFFRGTPVLVQILIWGYLGALYPTIFLGLPFMGVVFGSWETSAVIGAFAAACLGLGLNEAAYDAELVRAGIMSVSPGQSEAALSLGMPWGMTMTRVVLPQAMRIIIPPFGNNTISMLKTTSLVSVIGGNELLTRLETVWGQTFQIIPLLVVACIWYLALTTVFSVGQYYLEKYYGKGHSKKSEAPKKRKKEPVGLVAKLENDVTKLENGASAIPEEHR
jgi:polar amino acid transport system permease protein